MIRLCLAVLLTLSAQPVLALSEKPQLPAERIATVERLYPELDVEGEGWRGLLPIMLMNADRGMDPQSAGADTRQPSAVTTGIAR
jgi:hypothetical protein